MTSKRAPSEQRGGVASVSKAAFTQQSLDLSEEAEHQREIYTKSRRRRGWEKLMYGRKIGSEYLNATHTFQLKHGDTPFGAPKVMTGREAHALNKQYEAKFFNDRSPNARMWKWWCKSKQEETDGATGNT